MDDAAAVVRDGRAHFGVELGSTRIKACLIDDAGSVLATGGRDWENRLVDGVWTYSLDDVEDGLRAASRDLAEDVRRRYDLDLTGVASIGVSAMMHGYLAFDADGSLLVPFRTWRNTSTGAAAAELTAAFGVNIPQRWSIAHLHQAVLDGEEHLTRIASLTTLAGWVHRRLTGEDVLGVGDASGMFPIDPATHDWDADRIARYDALAAGRLPAGSVRNLLPRVQVAGRSAGRLTEAGAALLDPDGRLTAGAVAAPPEGDAGTGMVATDSVAPRQGNVSVGTSVFAMVVLEGPLQQVHEEVDLVTTPAGDPVAMVHCNNGASELAAWADVFARFADAAGHPVDRDDVFRVLLAEAMRADPGADGVLAYNTLAGEPVVGLTEGRPLIVREPGGRLTLAALMRAQLAGVFGVLALGMRVLDAEGVRVERLLAHGGLLRTRGAAEHVLAALLGVPVAVGETAAEGGAWGMAVLAAYAAADTDQSLGDWLAARVFADARFDVVEADPDAVAASAAWLDRYAAGLAVERAAVDALR